MTMESNSHALVPQLLEVIQNVSTMACSVTVNERECKRIADRFSAIGEGLTGVGQDQNFCGGKAIDATGTLKDYPNLHWLLAVLQKGEALVFRYVAVLVARCRDIVWHGKQPEEFQKIHEELDAFNTQFDFERYRDGFAKDYATVSGTMTTTETKGEFVVHEYLKIDPLDIQLGERIGKGANAEVYKATWSGCECAVKRFEASCMNDDYISKLQMELDFLIQLRHPYLVPLMGLSVDSEHRCSIVMELMSCSLRGLIDSRLKSGRSVPFDSREAVMIMKKIALGMRFVHSRGVSHRDLKAANVMVVEHPLSIDVKIADFGEAQFVDPSKAYGSAGTMAWMAPEILPPVATSSKPSNVDLMAADVYSFAMTCFEVLSGKMPFSGSLGKEQKKEVKSGLLRPVLAELDLDSRLVALIEACWGLAPEKRPNFESICCSLDQVSKFRNDTEVTESLPSTEDVVHRESADNVEVRSLSICMDDSASGSESENDSIGGWAFSIPDHLKINHFNCLKINPFGSLNSFFVKYNSVEWLGCAFSAIGIDKIFSGRLQREIDVMVSLRHLQILQLVGIHETLHSIVMVTERVTLKLSWMLHPNQLSRIDWIRLYKEVTRR